jgi:Ca2+-binding EF-hand superfamily protein
MKTTKFLTMTAAVALFSAPALAGEVYFIDTDGDGYAETSIENQLIGGQTFATLDDNKDGRVSQTEFQNNTILEETAAEFALYDTNQNGFISAFELYTNSKFGNAELVDNANTVVRTNSGQRIGSLRARYYAEDPYYMNASTGERYELVDDADYFDWPQELTLDIDRVSPDSPLFEQIDDNNNGFISFPEFQANTVHGNEYAVFAMFDKNQDDAISPFEFNRYEKTGGVR